MSVEDRAGNIEIIEAMTQRKYVQFEYTWNIFNFVSSGNYESPNFSPDRCTTIAFYLNLDGKTIRPTLCTLPCQIPDISLQLTLSLESNGGVPTIQRKTVGPENFLIKSSTSVKKFTFIESFTQRHDNPNNDDSDYDFWLDGNPPFKSLEINCKFQMNLNEFFSWGITMIKAPECVLLDSLKKLFEKREYSDVIFDVCGQEFPAHKTILSMNSPVFAMMFDHQMIEKLQNRVNVTDIDPKVFTEMLRYIYTGKVENVNTVAEKLLVAADKYNLARLKLMCQEFLQLALTVENAVDTLVLADCYSAELLKARTAEYINLNIGQVINTEGFQEMTKSNPILMAEILRATAGKCLQ